MQPNPLHALNVCDTIDKIGNMAFAINVGTIVSQFLRDHLKLFHANSHQLAHFLQYFFFGPAVMFTHNQRDCAISTMPIASFADFQISIMPRCREASSTVTHSYIGLAQLLKQ